MTIHSFSKYCDNKLSAKNRAMRLKIQRQIWHGNFPVGLLCREEQTCLKYIIRTTIISVILQVCIVVIHFTEVVWCILSSNQHSSSQKNIKVLVPSLLKWTLGDYRINDLPLYLAKHRHICDLIVWRNMVRKRQQCWLKNSGQQEQNGEMWRNAKAIPL